MSKTAGRKGVVQGFTLVELLVVVGVITILIALLLPALSKARLYAKQVQCTSNIRQCGMAVLNYANENKGWLPYNDGGINIWDPFSVCTNTTGGYSDPVWRPMPPYGIYNPIPSQPFSGALNNYIGDFRVWGCPNVGAPPLTDPANQGTKLNSNYVVCWGSAGPTFSNANPRRLAGMPDPVHVVLIQDFATQSNSSGWAYVRTNHPVGGQAGPCTSYTWDSPGYIASTNPSDMTFYLAVRSTKTKDSIAGINCAFLDFHVEWIAGGSLSVGDRDSNGWEYGSGAQRNVMTVKRSAN